jgi:hypothetical protein
MTGFIGLFDAARDYTLQSTATHIHALVSTVTSSLSLPGNGFQQPTVAFL